VKINLSFLWTKLPLYIIYVVNSAFPALSNSIISFECYLILASRETFVINYIHFHCTGSNYVQVKWQKNKHGFFPCTAIIDWSLLVRRDVFTARNVLNI
jgi:hypothetical protein